MITKAKEKETKAFPQAREGTALKLGDLRNLKAVDEYTFELWDELPDTKIQRGHIAIDRTRKVIIIK